MKKIILYMLLISMTLVTLSVTACSSESTEELKFGARAAYTISQHIGENPETAASSFTISYIDYQIIDEHPQTVVIATLFYPDRFSRNVYALSTGGTYYETKLKSDEVLFNEETQLYIANYGDVYYEELEDIRINEIEVLNIFNKYIKSNDLSLLGLE